MIIIGSHDDTDVLHYVFRDYILAVGIYLLVTGHNPNDAGFQSDLRKIG